MHSHRKHCSMDGKCQAISVKLPILNADSAPVIYVTSGQ